MVLRRTPALTKYSCEEFPSRTTWCCLLLRKDKIRPHTWHKFLSDLSLWRRPACQTLLRALYIYIYILYYLYILYYIYIYIYIYVYIYIYSATAWVVPDLWKALTILPDTSVKRYAVDQEDLKPFCCIQIIVWNSLHNKYAKCCEEFCLLQTKVFLRIETYICNLWCNFGYKQHLFW